MSCNGCRVLRKGCSDSCILRQSLQWIDSPEAQANATLFVSKFFGRGDLMAFISAVPESKRAALFQSLLFEACGRTVNPVNGAVGLLSAGKWQVCQAAVETVLAGGELRPIYAGIPYPDGDEGSYAFLANSMKFQNRLSEHSTDFNFSPATWISAGRGGRGRNYQAARIQTVTMSFDSGRSEMLTCSGSDKNGVEEPKLLNLFV
ncbi:LOB domain-containing protein 38-like [Cornus florida]|uniref:LOB domain-containing protein 38-like n=1 Tax=Cornus florida TaxID=4283 RepID=UPI00289F03D6|nr:LOB domain-containing protein 38-like [Cornus florida]